MMQRRCGKRPESLSTIGGLDLGSAATYRYSLEKEPRFCPSELANDCEWLVEEESQ